MVEMVPLQLHRDVQRHPLRRAAMREFPGDAVQPAPATVFKLETEMLLLEYFRRAAQHHPAHAKDWLRVTLAKWMECIQFFHQSLVDLLRGQPCRQVQSRFGNVTADMGS